MIDLSVAICTYNGESRLSGLLNSLKQQQTDCQWEVVVVDNNSDDGTAELVHRYQTESATLWRTDVPLRYCFEPQQGLAFARRCAVSNTNGTFIGFLDDDTLPDVGWVSAAARFGQQHPNAGAYGSSIRGQYEVPPPTGFSRIACCLAVIDRGERPFQYSAKRGVLPAGAGMVIRRQAWLAQVPQTPQLAGVCAASLKAKGEDVETLSYIRLAWAIWHNPAMKLTHVIPKERLEPEYLQRLFWQIGMSRYPLRRLGYSLWQWPFMLFAYFLNDGKKLLVYLFKVRQMNTVERCEFALLAGALFSPFGWLSKEIFAESKEA